MIVKCVANDVKSVFQRNTLAHDNPKGSWPITIGDSYMVYGLSLWNGNLHYLVVKLFKNNNLAPSFCPAELFEITDPRLPKDWYFSFRGTERKNDAVWGYKELALDPKYIEAMLEVENDAIAILIERMKEIDEYFSQT